MKITNNGIIMQNKVFLWIALVIGLLLLVPSVAMQFSNGVGWTLADFIVAGILLLGTGSAFVFLAKICQISNCYRNRYNVGGYLALGGVGSRSFYELGQLTF